MTPEDLTAVLRACPCCGGERRLLILSAALADIPADLRNAVTDLDPRNARRVVRPITHATGQASHVTTHPGFPLPAWRHPDPKIEP